MTINHTQTIDTAATRSRPGLLDRWRPRKPHELVQVVFTGHPKAALAVALELTRFAIVTSMNHTVDPQPDPQRPVIRLKATCYPVQRIPEHQS